LGLIEPSEQEFLEMMALWEEDRKEQRLRSFQMRLAMVLQMLKPTPL
jgi:hypothetical protein